MDTGKGPTDQVKRCHFMDLLPYFQTDPCELSTISREFSIDNGFSHHHKKMWMIEG